jgi:hypothetical protein
MPLWPLYLSALVSAVNFTVHTFIGGPQIIGPLRASRDLPQMVRGVLWMVWHMVTLVLALMALLFLLAALWQSRDLALAGAALSGALFLAGVVVVPLSGLSYREAPQGWLFLPAAALGAYALIA